MTASHKVNALTAKEDKATSVQSKAEEAKAKAKANANAKRPNVKTAETDAKQIAKGNAVRKK